MKNRVEATWDLADRMCRAANEHVFITIVEIEDGMEKYGVKRWAGGEPNEAASSRAPYIGPAKLSELLIDDAGNPFQMSPNKQTTLSTGFMGGVRRRIDKHTQVLTSASAWKERCDALFALVLNYATDHDVQFHHIGNGYKTEEEMMKAVRQDEEKFHVAAINVPAEDHIRYYLKVIDKTAPKGWYWIEHQYGEGVIKPGNKHWDVVTLRPEELLNFIGQELGGQEMWGDSLTGPVGVVWQNNRGDIPFGIMARSQWIDWEQEK